MLKPDLYNLLDKREKPAVVALLEDDGKKWGQAELQPEQLAGCDKKVQPWLNTDVLPLHLTITIPNAGTLDGKWVILTDEMIEAIVEKDACFSLKLPRRNVR